MPTRDLPPILCLPDPRLRSSARTVRLPDPEVERLIDELSASMRAARGLGLAAPQIGRDERVAVVEADGRQLVLINPEIVARRGRQLGWEGCLSVPNLVAHVQRPAEVTVVGIDRGGRPVRYRCSGLLARAVAHEVDHLAGRLYVDLVDPASLVDVREHPTPPTVDPKVASTTPAEAVNR